jgi:hypothetical protein
LSSGCGNGTASFSGRDTAWTMDTRSGHDARASGSGRRVLVLTDPGRSLGGPPGRSQAGWRRRRTAGALRGEADRQAIDQRLEPKGLCVRAGTTRTRRDFIPRSERSQIERESSLTTCTGPARRARRILAPPRCRGKRRLARPPSRRAPADHPRRIGSGRALRKWASRDSNPDGPFGPGAFKAPVSTVPPLARGVDYRAERERSIRGRGPHERRGFRIRRMGAPQRRVDRSRVVRESVGRSGLPQTASPFLLRP